MSEEAGIVAEISAPPAQYCCYSKTAGEMKSVEGRKEGREGRREDGRKERKEGGGRGERGRNGWAAQSCLHHHPFSTSSTTWCLMPPNYSSPHLGTSTYDAHLLFSVVNMFKLIHNRALDWGLKT